MKIFDARFAIGTILTALGTLGVIIGLFSFLPPTSNIVLGILLITTCVPVTILGYRFAKNMHPDPAKTTIQTLRNTGLLDKKSENNKK